MSRKPEAEPGANRIRLDKWLFYARFFKTRSLAAAIVVKGHLRINGQKSSKPGHGIGPGDVLTFRQADQIRVIRILDCGTRRGPAPEAQLLYDDLAPAGDVVPPVTLADE